MLFSLCRIRERRIKYTLKCEVSLHLRKHFYALTYKECFSFTWDCCACKHSSHSYLLNCILYKYKPVQQYWNLCLDVASENHCQTIFLYKGYKLKVISTQNKCTDVYFENPQKVIYHLSTTDLIFAMWFRYTNPNLA